MDLHKQTHYDILGLDLYCTIEQIKLQYRRLILVHHPDKGGSEDVFKAIQSAAEVLLDESLRRQYDDLLREARRKRTFVEAVASQRSQPPGAREGTDNGPSEKWWDDFNAMFNNINVNDKPGSASRPLADIRDEWGMKGKKSRYRRRSCERIWVEF